MHACVIVDLLVVETELESLYIQVRLLALLSDSPPSQGQT